MADNTQTNPNELVESAASSPKSYEVDGEKVTAHSLPELVQAAKYLANAKASSNPFKALKIARISTQGAER